MSDASSKSPGGTSDGAVPNAVVNRLSLYLRELQHLLGQGQQTTNSHRLGQLLGFTDAQVRKDLAYFGHFGYPGIGYRCDELVAAIRKILGTDRTWPVALIGAGNLGRALLGYKGFGQQNFQIVAAFDVDQGKIGTEVEGVPIYHLDRLGDVVRERHIKLAMVAAPAAAAQSVADQLVAAGIEGIVNFAPLTIQLPDHVQRLGVDLAIQLEQLSFLVKRGAKGERPADEPPTGEPAE